MTGVGTCVCAYMCHLSEKISRGHIVACDESQDESVGKLLKDFEQRRAY